jgi:hypothetical protein
MPVAAQQKLAHSQVNSKREFLQIFLPYHMPLTNIIGKQIKFKVENQCNV